MGLRVVCWGRGEPVVLVHGSVLAGELSWSEQRPLAERWRLTVPDRPGFAPGERPESVDFEADSEPIAELLRDGAHIVGHSYGGIVSLLAAARRPDAVRSLTVIEPPAFGVARGHPEVDAFVPRLAHQYRAGPRDPAAYLRGFYELVGIPGRVPSPLPKSLRLGAEALRVERGPWEAEVPLERLARAPFRKLVVSGAHHPAFDAVCDVLERRLGARRAVVAGGGHAVQRTGAPFNRVVEGFLAEG
jgi:pimeloyl-ACP methyl ester carboxylesterase